MDKDCNDRNVDPPEKSGSVSSRPDRIGFATEVSVRRIGGRRFRVRLFDGSREGCKIEFVERPSVGEMVWITFDGLESIEASVRWIEGHVGGVQFKQPLHEAVFNHFVSKRD